MLQCLLFGALAAATVEVIPLRLVIGPDSVLGVRPLTEVLGGVDEIELAISTATLNRLLGTDELTREQWMDFVVQSSQPRVDLDELYRRQQEGRAGDVAQAEVPPEAWPFEGRFGRSCRPALGLVAAGGLDLGERHLESTMLGRVDLEIELMRAPAALLLVLLAPLLSFIVMPAAGTRWPVAGLLSGIVAAVLAFAVFPPIATFGAPRLSPEWSAWVDRLVSEGRLEPMDLFTAGNVGRCAATAAAWVLASCAAAWRLRQPYGVRRLLPHLLEPRASRRATTVGAEKDD